MKRRLKVVHHVMVHTFLESPSLSSGPEGVEKTWGSEMSVQVLVLFSLVLDLFTSSFIPLNPGSLICVQRGRNCVSISLGSFSFFVFVLFCFKENFPCLAPHFPLQQSSAVVNLSWGLVW